MRYTTRLFPDPRDVALIQIKNILAPGVADPHGHWHSCKLAINNCSSNQLDLIQGFRTQFLRTLTFFFGMQREH
ncbi:unnamed protein product [Trifolium pratense]|uniref:Uncharacterized protein n=1 Tax=Trifolium pratense TaxID=57577 RepID=A0ACB0MAV5_TRIPR|nr:unnamed protein product [Trifolium pratense]